MTTVYLTNGFSNGSININNQTAITDDEMLVIQIEVPYGSPNTAACVVPFTDMSSVFVYCDTEGATAVFSGASNPSLATPASLTPFTWNEDSQLDNPFVANVATVLLTQPDSSGDPVTFTIVFTFSA